MKTKQVQIINITALLAAAVMPVFAGEGSKLKEAKLIIEHNATDQDTGFQGFIDSEGWQKLEVSGPGGLVLGFEGKGALGTLGITELFFETVEPGNVSVPLKDMLAKLPAGDYVMKGQRMENGKTMGEVTGVAALGHTIPAGPALLSPAEGAAVATEDVTMKWGAVTKSITGDPVKIIAYQLIVERDEEPHARMVGKFALNVRFPGHVTSMQLPDGFLEAGTKYKWEVLAVEEGGNQTLSSSEFSTVGRRTAQTEVKEDADEDGKEDEEAEEDGKAAAK